LSHCCISKLHSLGPPGCLAGGCSAGLVAAARWCGGLQVVLHRNVVPLSAPRVSYRPHICVTAASSRGWTFSQTAWALQAAWLGCSKGLGAAASWLTLRQRPTSTQCRMAPAASADTCVCMYIACCNQRIHDAANHASQAAWSHQASWLAWQLWLGCCCVFNWSCKLMQAPLF